MLVIHDLISLLHCIFLKNRLSQRERLTSVTHNKYGFIASKSKNPLCIKIIAISNYSDNLQKSIEVIFLPSFPYMGKKLLPYVGGMVRARDYNNFCFEASRCRQQHSLKSVLYTKMYCINVNIYLKQILIFTI